MQRNGKPGSDCVERVELLMKNLGFRKNVSTNRRITKWKVVQGRSGRQTDWGNISESLDPHVIPK
jgi:hypothetical protein